VLAAVPRNKFVSVVASKCNVSRSNIEIFVVFVSVTESTSNLRNYIRAFKYVIFSVLVAIK
jgi:hypothetical protein